MVGEQRQWPLGDFLSPLAVPLGDVEDRFIIGNQLTSTHQFMCRRALDFVENNRSSVFQTSEDVVE